MMRAAGFEGWLLRSHVDQMWHQRRRHDEHKYNNRLVQSLGFSFTSTLHNKWFDVFAAVAFSLLMRACACFQSFGNYDEPVGKDRNPPSQHKIELERFPKVLFEDKAHDKKGRGAEEHGLHPQTSHLHHDRNKFFPSHQIEKHGWLDEKEPYCGSNRETGK